MRQPPKYDGHRSPPDSAARHAGGEADRPIRYLIDDQDRYSRLRLISWWRQERLRQARVMVVGRGRAGQRSHEKPGPLGSGDDVPDRPGRGRAIEPVAVGAVSRAGRRPAQGRGRRAASVRAQPRDHDRRRCTVTSSPISGLGFSPTSTWSSAAWTIARPGSGSTGSAGRPALPGSTRASRRFRGWSRSSSLPIPRATSAR